MDKEIIKLIKGAGSLAIFPHVSADGDAIGSVLALALAMRKAGRESVVYLEENIPSVYTFLPGVELARFYDGGQEVMDINIALDTGDEGRLGTRKDVFFNAPCTINIDHHATNNKFAHHNFVDPHSASTGEIVFQLLKALKIEMDADIATCLYTAIATDTGGFKYSNTTAETHITAAELVSTGIDIGELNQRIFDNSTFEKLKLTQKAIELLELHEGGRIALTPLSVADFQATGAKDEDCDGIVNIGRSIEGVEVSVLIKERKDGDFRINLRSKSYVDVSQIAVELGGGGHKRAAGCTVTEGSIEEVKNRLLDRIKTKLI